jgi:dUTPase
MDISELKQNIEDDYYISSFFPVEVQYYLEPLIEHRIKLMLKYSVVFHAGESQNVETCCVLDIKQKKLSLSLKSFEHLPVTFESEGSISYKFKGRIKVNLTNYSCQTMKMHAGSTVGYIVLQPYSIK